MNTKIIYYRTTRNAHLKEIELSFLPDSSAVWIFQQIILQRWDYAKLTDGANTILLQYIRKGKVIEGIWDKYLYE